MTNPNARELPCPGWLPASPASREAASIVQALASDLQHRTPPVEIADTAPLALADPDGARAS